MCAVRVEMACGPGARQPPSSAWVILRVLASVSFHAADWNTAVRAGLPWCTGVRHAGMGSKFTELRIWAMKGSEHGLRTWALKGSEHGL